jgi:hypothetical protein
MADVYVFCPRKSNGALELVRALGAKRLRKFDGADFWDKKKRFAPKEGSVFVAWGTSLPPMEGMKVLNSLESSMNKYQENQALVKAGVATVLCGKYDERWPLERYLKSGYLPRSFYHSGGADLLAGCKPDFFVQKLNIVEEYRIHSFSGKSIRAGKKEVREGFTKVEAEKDWKPNSNLAHPWIRSFDGGWRINYDGFKSTSAMRNLAHAAVKALGLTFGAVDIAKTSDGNLLVLEVNSAPGLEGNTVQSYLRAITKWAGTDPEKEVNVHLNVPKAKAKGIAV